MVAGKMYVCRIAGGGDGDGDKLQSMSSPLNNNVCAWCLQVAVVRAAAQVKVKFHIASPSRDDDAVTGVMTVIT